MLSTFKSLVQLFIDKGTASRINATDCGFKALLMILLIMLCIMHPLDDLPCSYWKMHFLESYLEFCLYCHINVMHNYLVLIPT